MKYLNTSTQYQSKVYPHPTYFNSYVRDGRITIGEKSDYLEIFYLFCHEVNGEEVVIERSPLIFTEEHIPTIMKTGEEVVDGETEIQTMEVYEAILSGVPYDRDKIVNWGRPDLHKVMQMFELSSLTNGTSGVTLKELTEISVGGTVYPITPSQSTEIRQLMVDWIGKSVLIEGEELCLNFSIYTT